MKNSKMKIGIMGGTFDPFTEAHEAIVRKVLDAKLVDQVIIVPTVVDYYRDKDDKWLTDKERARVIRERVDELIRCGKDVSFWFNELDACKGVAQETFRKWRRFVHTLADFIAWKEGGCVDEYGVAHEDEEVLGKDYGLYTIIGTDQYKTFKNWFMWEDILKLSKLIVVDGRGGEWIVGRIPKENDIPCKAISIDEMYSNVSATKIRREYKGTEDAVARYIKRLPPLREKVLQHTPIFDLVEKAEVQPGFKPVGINAPDWVTVVIRNKDTNKYLMVKQLRYGTMQEYSEFVCGQVEKDEHKADAALREVREETGITSNSGFYLLGSFDTNPAFMNNKMHFFLCEVRNEDLRISGKQQLDEHEKITTEWVDCDKIDVYSSSIPWICPAFERLAIELVKNYYTTNKR